MSYQEYQKRKVQEIFGAPLEDGERDRVLRANTADDTIKEEDDEDEFERDHKEGIGTIVGGSEVLDGHIGTRSSIKSGYHKVMDTAKSNFSETKVDEHGLNFRKKKIETPVKKSSSGFNFTNKTANQIMQQSKNEVKEVYLTREQEMQMMKSKSKGTDYSLGKNRSEDKRYEIFGSRRY